MVKLSLWDDSQREIDCHKWIASQRAGRDLGETAIRDWIRFHWSGYLRARWIEHLEGTKYWVELDGKDYGLLQREFRDKTPLLSGIVERLKNGQENLHIIQWAIDCQISMNDVIDILSTLDINSKRMAHRFEPGNP